MKILHDLVEKVCFWFTMRQDDVHVHLVQEKVDELVQTARREKAKADVEWMKEVCPCYVQLI